MRNFGLITTLAGSDANTAPPEKAAFHSEYPNPKIRIDVSPMHFGYTGYTFASNPSPNTITNLFTLDHGYPYRPAAVVYYRQNDGGFTTGFKILPWYMTTSNAYARVIYYIDETAPYQLKIDFQRDTDGGVLDLEDFTGLDFDFKYYVFAEPGA